MSEIRNVGGSVGQPGRQHPCPKGDECALNKGAVSCFHCGRNWPPDETWQPGRQHTERADVRDADYWRDWLRSQANRATVYDRTDLLEAASALDRLAAALQAAEEKHERAVWVGEQNEQAYLQMRAHFDKRMAETAAALRAAEEALDALRWKNNDGTYEDNCWCDVKSTDYPSMHMPRCVAARAALAAASTEGADE